MLIIFTLMHIAKLHNKQTNELIFYLWKYYDQNKKQYTSYFLHSIFIFVDCLKTAALDRSKTTTVTIIVGTLA